MVLNVKRFRKALQVLLIHSFLYFNIIEKFLPLLVEDLTRFMTFIERQFFLIIFTIVYIDIG